MELFYYGNNADYGEILREVNQIRYLQREIFLEHYREIPEGLIELPENLPIDAFRLTREGMLYNPATTAL